MNEPEPSDPRPAAARMPLQELVGQKLGEYTIQRVLGHGSMGVVFEAVHDKLGRQVALKVLPPGLGATEKAIQRFLREAQAVAQLSHENIVPIYEIGNVGATHYYAMQLLEGEPLDKVLKRGPLTPRAAAKLACTAARAVHFAHQRGIIHRDIKPANMILTRDGDLPTGGKLVLTDFGLARPEQGGSITDSGALVGTPLYMSPEQVRAHRVDVDRRTDVWSLGATLYEMLAGRPPFSGETTQEILQNILDQEPSAPSTWRSDVPGDLEVIALKALEKERKRRYASALELAQDLERFLEGEPILARRTTVLARGWRRIRKHRTIAVLSLAVALITLGFAIALNASSRQADSQVRSNRFRSALEQAQSLFNDEKHLTAVDKFDEALKEIPDDLDARLGRARALFYIGLEWVEANQKQKEEQRPQLATRFGSAAKLHELARSDVEAVLVARPKLPLALFCRGALRFLSKDALERSEFLNDLLLAEDIGLNDCDTQAELARFRLLVARSKDTPPAQVGELRQFALTNASQAVVLVEAQVGDKARTDPIAAARVIRVLRLRAQVYQELFDVSGNVREYLEYAETDCVRALDLDTNDQRSLTLLGFIRSRMSDAAKGTTTGAPAVATAGDSADAIRNVAELFGLAEKSAQSEQLSNLLRRTGELLTEGWRQTDGLREGLADSFVNPYLPKSVKPVTDEERQLAEEAAERARAMMRSAAGIADVNGDLWRAARRELLVAIEKNPRNAQYAFEVAMLEQDLNLLEDAHTHLNSAVEIAPSNPLFFRQLALICQKTHRIDEALRHARRTAELAPGNAEFVAHHARLALDAAHVATEAAARTPLLAEARDAIEELDRVQHDHPQLSPLREALGLEINAGKPSKDEPPASEAKDGG